VLISELEQTTRTAFTDRRRQSATMRPHPVSYAESPESGTTGIERCVTGFPVGFGGWTASKMYQRSSKSSYQQHAACETDNAAASASRQEVHCRSQLYFTSLYFNSRHFLLQIAVGPLYCCVRSILRFQHVSRVALSKGIIGRHPV